MMKMSFNPNRHADEMLKEFCDASQALGCKTAEINSEYPVFSGSCGYSEKGKKQYKYSITKSKSGVLKVAEKRDAGYVAISRKVKRNILFISELMYNIEDSLNIMTSKCADKKKIEKVKGILANTGGNKSEKI